jgi:hypothetical protein
MSRTEVPPIREERVDSENAVLSEDKDLYDPARWCNERGHTKSLSGQKIPGVPPTANIQDIIRVVRETQDAETGKIDEARAPELAQKLSQLGK